MSETGPPEILFYHLQRRPLEAVLPTLVERSLSRGWRVVVEATSEERLAALDDLLWTFAEDAFVPHGRDDDPDAADEPVILTLGPANPNGAQIRFLVENAPLPEAMDRYARVVVLFDGNDDTALAVAREAWRVARHSGEATYWQQDENGRWEKKA